MAWDDYKEIPYCARCFRDYSLCVCSAPPKLRWPNIPNKAAPPPKFLIEEPWFRSPIDPQYENWLEEVKKKKKYGERETGYYDGQADALSFLNGDVSVDDKPTAPLHRDLEAEYCLWCLGLNLAVAGGLKKAEMKGKSEANDWNYNRRYRTRYG